MLDISAKVETLERETQRAAELDRRDKEHGGLIPSDRIAEEIRRSVAGWGPFRSETKAADISGKTQRDAQRFQRVTLQRLWIDCGYATRRWGAKLSRDAADTVRSDALMLLVKWTSHGGGIRPDGKRNPALDLGPAGMTPRRRDWLETVERADGKRETRLTLAARYALRAAIKQAIESPAMRDAAIIEQTEESTDALDIAGMVEEHQRETDAATRLPDIGAPEVIRDALDIPLDAARAIVARAYPAATPRDLAESWRITEGALKVSLSRGAAQVRQTYPQSADLLDALDAAAAKWRNMTQIGATLALMDYRDGIATETQARDAVSEYASAHASLGMEQRATLAAARCAAKREGAAYGSPIAEHVAFQAALLIRAETQRAHRSASIAALGSHFSGKRDAAGRMSARISAAQPQPQPAETIGATDWFRYGNGYSGACAVNWDRRAR